MNSEDRKGVAARAGSWVQSFWLQPDGSTCRPYVLIAVVALAVTALFAMESANADALGASTLLIIETLVLGLMIASLVKGLLWRDEKLRGVRNLLLDTAFQKCRCDASAIIIESAMEPETVGRPLGKGYCHVCRARAALKDHFPGAIETEIRERLGEYRGENDGRWVLNNLPFNPNGKTGPIPEDLDLAAYLKPVELEWHRANGQLPAVHQAKPQ